MVDRVILYIELPDAQMFCKSLGTDERCETGMEPRAGPSFDRQQLAVSPEVLRPPLDRVAGEKRPDGLVVVADLERPEALVADPQRRGREQRLTEMTTKSEIHAVVSRYNGKVATARS